MIRRTAAVVAALVAAGIIWILWPGGGRQRDVERTPEDASGGYRYGETTDEIGCMDEALSRYREKGGQSGADAAAAFLSGCLRVSGASAGFCDDVPPSANAEESRRWRIDRCAHEKIEDPSCRTIFAAVQKHCEGDDWVPDEEIDEDFQEVEP